MDSDRNLKRRKFLKATSGLTVGSVVAGCTGGDGGDGGGGGDAETTAEETTAGGNGGDGGDSTPSLEERAKEEGTVSVAQSMSGWEPFIQQFQDETDITVDLFRTDSTKIASRVIQEANANKLSFDVVGTGSTIEIFVQILENDIFQSFVPSAVKEAGAVDSRLFANKQGQSLYDQESLVFLYNEENVNEPPTTLKEWFNWDGTYSLDVRDYVIYAMLRDAHGAQRAKEIVSKLGKNARWISSHFDMAQQIASGEVQAGMTYSKYRGYDWGGPLKKQKIEGLPTMFSSSSYGFAKNPNNPNAAHYWMNYVHNNLVDFLNENVMDVFYRPENTPDGFVWDYKFVQNNDLSQLEETWKQEANIEGSG